MGDKIGQFYKILTKILLDFEKEVLGFYVSSHPLARFEKTITMVHCVKLGRDLEALESPPFPGELGERLYNEVSQQGWEMWQGQATIIIKEIDPQCFLDYF